ncbi:MAG: ThuA domain-containing protein [Kiritimatiellae bacterium]|nr:ThuA domain-containing protein [Kiritimatiellia bacterium]
MSTETKPVGATSRRVLLFGGGGCHDFKVCCPVLKGYLEGEPGLSVDYAAEDYDVFTAERIAPYDLIVMYHTGGQLSVPQRRGLVEAVAAGKSFVGVHAAADSFSEAPDYRAMVGGYFRAHPFMRDYIVSLTNEKHPVTAGIAGYSVEHWEKWPVFEYRVHDEQYLLDYDNRVELLAVTTFRGRLWPVSWVKPWGKGKVFYLALGHDVEACRNPFFRQMFMGGVRWAVAPAPYAAPATTRFAIS